MPKIAVAPKSYTTCRDTILHRGCYHSHAGAWQGREYPVYEQLLFVVITAVYAFKAAIWGNICTRQKRPTVHVEATLKNILDKATSLGKSIPGIEAAVWIS
jgi:hypothetical protein